MSAPVGGGGPEVNKFEQVYSDGQMSIVWRGRGQGSNALRAVLIWDPASPPCGQIDTYECKHYLPTTSLAGGKYRIQ